MSGLLANLNIVPPLVEEDLKFFAIHGGTVEEEQGETVEAEHGDLMLLALGSTTPASFEAIQQGAKRAVAARQVFFEGIALALGIGDNRSPPSGWNAEMPPNTASGRSVTS